MPRFSNTEDNLCCCYSVPDDHIATKCTCVKTEYQLCKTHMVFVFEFVLQPNDISITFEF